jgi:nitrate/nitrite-specific signal transduction histidine kinase
MSSERSNLFERAEDFAQLFRRGADFARELVQENERLRRQLASVEQRDADAARDPEQWEKLRGDLLVRIEQLERERQDVLHRLEEIEAENLDFANRYVEVEHENNNLANLYVASYQLHSTLDLSEVLKIILEIVINLIGAERFAVYVLDERTNLLEAVASEGLERSALPSFALGQGTVGHSVATQETLCEDAGSTEDLTRPIVCIPLSVQDRTIGAITIYKLLTQKAGFTPLDYELFTLLAGHAATAILAARLHSQSERKLHTIQGFIDLLTK